MKSAPLLVLKALLILLARRLLHFQRSRWGPLALLVGVVWYIRRRQAGCAPIFPSVISDPFIWDLERDPLGSQK